MTLDGAIIYEEEVAEVKKKKACDLYDDKNYEESRECIWCAEEHRQIAEWLRELKQLREQKSKDELKDLSKRVENIEKKMEEDKEEQLKKLQAEIPQEPIWEKNSIPGPYCPRCNEKILTIKTKYCPNCGQAIDMSGFLNYLFFGNTRWSLLKEMGIEEGEK